MFENCFEERILRSVFKKDGLRRMLNNLFSEGFLRRIVQKDPWAWFLRRNFKNKRKVKNKKKNKYYIYIHISEWFWRRMLKDFSNRHAPDKLGSTGENRYARNTLGSTTANEIPGSGPGPKLNPCGPMYTHVNALGPIRSPYGPKWAHVFLFIRMSAFVCICLHWFSLVHIGFASVRMIFL